MVPSSLFILASSACKSLQCLISALTQRGEGGRSFRLTCSVVPWGGRQTNVTGVCGECPQCLGHTGFAPAHGVCAFPVYTAQAQAALQGSCLKCPWVACIPRCKPLGFRISVLHRGTDSAGPTFCALPRSESSGDHVLGEHALLRWAVCLTTSSVIFYSISYFSLHSNKFRLR